MSPQAETPKVSSTPLHPGPWLVTTLGTIAGFVDAVVYLTMSRLFVSNMTGNTNILGSATVEGNWDQLVRRAFPVLPFLLGAIVSGVLVEELDRRGAERRLWPFFLIEALLVGAYVGIGWTSFAGGRLELGRGLLFFFLVSLVALAMGVQNGALVRGREPSVHTTHVTGALTDFAEECVRIFYAHGRERHPEPGGAQGVSARPPSRRHLLGHLGIYLGFAAGAFAGSGMLHAVGLPSLAAPVIVLLGLAAADLARPLVPRD